MAADDNHSTPKHGTKTTASGVVSPNAAKKPKERVPFKPDFTEINECLMCSLCSGYLIDATAIIECQHTFCKSCILKYLETNSYCPICDVQLNKAKPHLSLRSDVIVQRLVYKLVPGLLVSELRRRRDFSVSKCGTDSVEAAESASSGMALEVESATDLSTILSLEDVVSLSIEYFRSCEDESLDNKQPLVHQKQEQIQQQPTTNVNHIQDIKGACSDEEANDRRYLQCPAAVSVGLLKKFIRMKYGLSDDYRVDLLYNGNRDNILENDLTLLDVAFIFKWNKDEPMRFHYRIFDRAAKSITSRSGTKRSAPSMMDEPPDDDAASGPQNRPSMTSTSPSSKIPRLSDNSTTNATGANSNTGSTGNSSSRSTSSAALLSSSPVYDFTEGNTSDSEKIITKKGKSRGLYRKDSYNTSKSSSQGLKRSPSNFRSHTSRSHSTEDKGERSGKVDSGSGSTMSRRSTSTNTNTSGNNRERSNSVEDPSNDNDIPSDDDGDSDSYEGLVSSVRSKNPESKSLLAVTNSSLRSAAHHVMQSQMINGALKFSLSASSGNALIDEKREPLKLSLGSARTKSPERRHKHKHHKLKHKEKKSLKLSLNLNQNSNMNQSISQSQNKSSGGKEVKFTLGKAQQNSELGTGGGKGVDGKGSGNAPAGSNSSIKSQNNLPNSVKTSTSAHLSNISKSISVSIGVNMSGNNNNSSGTPTGNSSTCDQTLGKRNQFGNSKILSSPTGLLPKNTGIEIQPTTMQAMNSQQNSNSNSGPGSSNNNSNQSASRSHPLLPDSVHVPKSVTLIPVNPNAMNSSGPGRGSSNSGGNLPEKSGSGTSNRLNAHTFTHPITNKSLHQITVTEVPPPPKSGSSSPSNNNSGNNGSIGNVNANSNSNSGGNSGSCTTNPIEKVIANAANKPQFNGPGSMEITKIYCGSKENPAKKLKERKGLDISISVPGMNANMKDNKCKSTQKLEETLRQKIGLSNSSTSAVTMNNNKMNKVVSQTPTTLLNAKMPPGITIGPAGISKNTLSIVNNPSGGSSSSSGNNSCSNTIKGLGFTLPPHITAHPQLPPGGIRNVLTNPGKSNEKSNLNRTSTKESTSGQANHSMNNMNKAKPQSPAEPGMTNGNPMSGSKGQLTNRKHLGEALASMFDMATRNNVKSPSPPKNSNHLSKEKSLVPSPYSNQPREGSSNCEKRALDMTSPNRKSSRESPEPKRPRVNEGSKPSSSSVNNESPLDLSGRSSRPSSASGSNSNSCSPTLGHAKSSFSPNSEKIKSNETSHHSSNGPNTPSSKRSSTPTPIPKKSPNTTTSTGMSSSSPNMKSNHQDSSKNSLKPSNTSGTGTSSTPSIMSIAHSLAQKQQQLQQQQNLHNQIMQLHQGHHNILSNHNANGNQGKSVNSSLKGSNSNSSGNNNPGNMNPTMGLSALSPPIIQMPNPSSPGSGPSFDPLRNLLTLSDVAVRHGKLQSMNNLMAAVGLCPSMPPHTMSLTGSPSSVVNSLSHHPGLFSHLPPHLANSLGGGKSPSGILDPSHAQYLAALTAAHNERLAAGMNPFGGSLSPPISLANSFYASHQVRPPSNSPLGSLRIPTVTPKSSSSNNSSKTKGSTPPLSFSHPPTVPAPRSPNHHNNNIPSSLSASTKSTPTSPPVSQISISPLNSSVTSHSMSTKPSSSDSSSTSSNLMKNMKINGTLSNTLPLMPPGIHNPLLPIYTRTQTSTHNASGNLSSAMNKNIKDSSSSISSSGNIGTGNATKVTYSDKKGIPNSMKISNFLPSKPKDGKAKDNSNVEATITSGSNVGGTSLTKFLNSIPPLIVSQSQPNLSVSSPSSSKDSSRLLSTATSTPGKITTTASNANSQECFSVFSTMMMTSTSNSAVMNSIKNETESVSEATRTSPTSSHSSKSNSDLLSHNQSKTTSPTPKVSLSSSSSAKEANKDAVAKSNSSSEIKSEEGKCAGATTTMGHSNTVGILPLSTSSSSSISPPLSSGRATSTTTTQPQNQAVRHIPNPALLFNRQNSNTASNQIASLIVPFLPVTNNITNCTEGRISKGSSPPGKNAPEIKPSLKLPVPEHPLQVPAIPFPGVSVPVQVKVDNDSVPIPITISETQIMQQEGSKTSPKLVADHLNVISKGINIKTSTQEKNEGHSGAITEVGKDSTIKELPKPTNTINTVLKTETDNQLSSVPTKEEIMKIEYSLDDTDQDIDVGTEIDPLFSNDEQATPIIEKSQNDENCIQAKEQKTLLSNTTAEVKVETSQKDIYSENKRQVETNVENLAIVKIENLPSPNSTGNDTAIAIKEDIKTSQTNVNEYIKTEAIPIEDIPQQEVSSQVDRDDDDNQMKMEIDAVDETSPVTEANIENKKAIQVNPIVPVAIMKDEKKAEVEAEDVDVGMDEPMEVNIDGLLEPLDNELEGENEKVQQEVNSASNILPIMESSSGENPEAEMEIVEATDTIEEDTDILVKTGGDDDDDSSEVAIIPTPSDFTPTVPITKDNPIQMEVCNEDETESVSIQGEMKEQPMEITGSNEINEITQAVVSEEKSTTDFNVKIDDSIKTAPSTENIPSENITIITQVSQPMEEDTSEIDITEKSVSSIPSTEKVEKVEELSLATEEVPVVPTAVVAQSKEVIREDLNPILNSNSNPIPNQININPEASPVQVAIVVREEDTMDEKNIKDSNEVATSAVTNTDESAELKEESNSTSTVNALENKPEAEELVVKEESSSSQLEIERNCPSLSGNDIELSNPIPTTTTTEVIPLIPDQTLEAHHDNGIENVMDITECEKPIEKENPETAAAKPVTAELPSSTNAKAEVETESQSQNIITNPEGDSMNSIVTEKKIVETPTETRATAISDPPSSDSIVVHNNNDFDNSVSPSSTSLPLALPLPPLPNSESPTKNPAAKDEEAPKPALISATATITTTKSEVSTVASVTTKTVEIEVGITENALASSISKNSLENPTSPANNITKRETLEKVAAGLFASATTAINNNNNTSLSMTTPTCDITITTINN